MKYSLHFSIANIIKEVLDTVFQRYGFKSAGQAKPVINKYPDRKVVGNLFPDTYESRYWI